MVLSTRVSKRFRSQSGQVDVLLDLVGCHSQFPCFRVGRKMVRSVQQPLCLLVAC
jgi:hypothetical protein